MNIVPDKQEPLTNRVLVRDVAAFQFKLVIDGLRDLVLVPVSLVAGLISLLSGKDGKPGTQFYELLEVGKESEEWIDLFGAVRKAPSERRHPVRFPDGKMDDLIDGIEAFVIDEERRGGMTAQARERFDKALRSLQDRRNTHSAGGTHGN